LPSSVSSSSGCTSVGSDRGDMAEFRVRLTDQPI